jgi:hypothetical protein
MVGTWEDAFDNFMDPHKHIAHSVLFVAAAVLTIIYDGDSSRTDNTVTLTNFKMLRVEELYDRTAKIDKAALYLRWKCNSTVDPWGPDSMCRCIQKKNCTDSEYGGGIETKCYKKVAPTYANVFAGYDVGYLNVLIAFLMIHIAVLLNMTIETKEIELREPKPDSQDSSEKMTDNKTSNATDPKPDSNDAQNGNDDDAGNDDNPFQDNRHAQGYNKKINVNGRKYGNKLTVMRQFRPIIVANGDAGGTPEGATEPLIPARTFPKFDQSLIQNEQTRLLVLLVLSGVCIICNSVSVAKKEEALRTNGQTCDIGMNTCLTQTFLAFMTLFWSLVNFILFSLESYRHMFHTDRDPSKTLTSHFLATVLEDVNHTVTFMLLAATFSALSGVHDDTTLLFDVLLVTFIGFLQNVQHNIMLARERVIEYCRTNGQGTVHKDHLGPSFSVETDVVSYFLYTRLFIFVSMIGTVIVEASGREEG